MKTVNSEYSYSNKNNVIHEREREREMQNWFWYGACMNLAYVCGGCVPRLNMSIPAENIAAALAFSSLVRSLEEKVKTLTADNEGLERELTNTQVDLRATKTEFTQHQEESQQALESLTKKCLAFEEELSKLLS